MGFFQNLNKVWSGLDFWDKDENRRQREEEEKKRRQQSTPTQTSSPQTRPSNPGLKVSTSIPNAPRHTITNVGGMDYSGTGLSDETIQNKRELEKLTQQFLAEKLEKEKNQTSWFDRTFTDRNWDKRAEAAARNKATRTFQEREGYNKDPAVMSYNRGTSKMLSPEKMRKDSGSPLLAPVLSVGRVGTGIVEGGAGFYDLVTPGHGVNRLSKASTSKAEEIDKLAQDLDIEGEYKTGNVAGEIASYFTPAVITKAGKVGTGLTKYGTKAADAIGDANKYRRFFQRGAQELFDPTNISKEIELTSRYLGQDAAKGVDISPGRVATDIAMGVGGAGIPALFRGLRKAPGGSTNKVVGQVDNLINRADDAPSLPGATSALDEGVPVGTGISSTNLDQPAYQRAVPETVGDAQSQFDLGVQNAPDSAFDADARLIDNTPQRTGFDDPLDRPTFEYKQDIDDIMKKANDDFNNYRAMHPNATPAQLIAVQRRISDQIAAMIGDAEAARYGKSTITQIPDVSDPIALAKADDQIIPPRVRGDEVMASFDEAQNGSLRKVDTGPEKVDVAGNPAMVSDAQMMREAIEQGVPMQRGDSPVGLAEEARSAARETAAREQVTRMADDAAAPRTREAASRRILEDSIRKDVMENPNLKETVNFAEAEMRAREIVRNLTDDDLVAGMRTQPKINDAQELFEVVDIVDRLGRLAPTPETTRAVTNAMDAITEFSSESGRRLRAVRELFKNMPGPMKKQYLIDRVEKKLGAELPDLQRGELIRRIDAADGYERQINEIEDILDGVRNDMELGVPVNRDEVRQLIDERKGLIREHEYAQGQAFEYSQQLLPKASVGKRAAQGVKTSMLSSPLRRLYDPIVTGITQAADTRDSAISGYLGRLLNKLPGKRGKFRDFKAGDIGTLVKGNVEGVADSGRALFKDQRRVDDMMGELQRATRADSQASRRTRPGRFIGDMTEFATEASRGSRSMRMKQLARQQAAEQGFKGADAKLYTEVAEATLDSSKMVEASEYHLRTNNLHQNRLNETVSGVQRSIEQKFPQAGPIFNVMTLPFKSWASGNISRLVTDKNILYNVVDITRHLRKDPQRALDSFGRLAGNTTEAAAVGYGLSKAGVFSDTDDNGETWGGPFINIMGRKVSIAILGPSALPVIAGYNIDQMITEDGIDTDRLNTIADQALDYTNASSTLAMDNRVSEVLTGQGDFNDRLIKATGDTLRKPIPTVTSDINAVLDQTGFNPTGERAETRAENEEGNKDYLQTEINKTLNRIPFISQNLPREEGSSSKDFIDRILDSTHPNDSTRTARSEEEAEEQREQSIEERDASFEEAGVPRTSDGIQSAVESGDWDKAIQGVAWELARAGDDGEISEKTKKEAEQEMATYQVYKDQKVTSETINMYDESGTADEGEITNSIWRDMMESGDPTQVELAEELYRLDDAMLKAGARSSRKYHWGDSKTGGRKKGSGGGGSSKQQKIATNIGTIGGAASFNPSFRPQKISFGGGTSVPRVTPVPSNDTSMLKKITVKRGGR